jgi:hypothetical protein
MDENVQSNEIVLAEATAVHLKGLNTENGAQDSPELETAQSADALQLPPKLWYHSDFEIMQHNFLEANSACCQINTRRLKEFYEYKTLSSESIRKYFSKGTAEGWEKFYKDFPHSLGLLSFSRAAFNKTKDKALLYFEHYKDSIECSGNFVFLIKHNRGWTIMDVITDWASDRRS